jgi:AraC-like DNA-binding protein
LGKVALANIAQSTSRGARYSDQVSPLRRRRVARRSDGIAFGRFEHEDRLYRGIKDRYAYVVIERGGWELWVRGRTYHVAAGDIVLKQPGEVYRDLRHDGPRTFDVILFDESVIDAARTPARVGELVFDDPVIRAGDRRARSLRALHATLAAATTRLAHEQAVATASDALVAAGSRGVVARSQERPAVARARAYLRERLAEDIHLDDLADHVRLDKYHLIRAFRAEVGMPPYEYLTHLRVAHACQLLRTGHSPASVAGALGYYDQSQLHRHFVRIVGMTPGGYARAQRH